MSDYIESQEYSMQLAAPGDDPFAYDWARLQEEVDGATSSLFWDITLASLQAPLDVDNVDLSGLHDALENDWRNIFSFNSQSLVAQPDNHHSVMRSNPLPNDEVQSLGTEADIDSRMPCDHPQCGKSFKRKGDLTRHKKLHNRSRRFVCTAQGCTFSFTRNDKLLDHVRAGHDSETLFVCLRPDCSMLLTKDILPLHNPWPHHYSNLSSFRQCPLPKCGFRTRSQMDELDEMQKHLLKSHDPKGRKQYASLLASRGYDSESGKILCPICPNASLFDKHTDFGFHFLAKHSPNCVVDENSLHEPRVSCLFPDGVGQEWGSITNEQRKHRRTILSLFPKFTSHPVWRDIKLPHRYYI